MSVFCSCDPSMPSLMRSLNSSHVVGAVSDVHGVCGLLPSAGLVSSILLSSLFWSSASCAMFGGPRVLILCVVWTQRFVGMKTALARLLVLMESACWIRRRRRCLLARLIFSATFPLTLTILRVSLSLGTARCHSHQFCFWDSSQKHLGFGFSAALLCCSCRLALPCPCLFGCCGDARFAFSFFLLPCFVVSAAELCYYSNK